MQIKCVIQVGFKQMARFLKKEFMTLKKFLKITQQFTVRLIRIINKNNDFFLKIISCLYLTVGSTGADRKQGDKEMGLTCNKGPTWNQGNCL